ncbi:hypothetical protein ACFQXA_10830 [Nocardiopsis composta]
MPPVLMQVFSVAPLTIAAVVGLALIAKVPKPARGPALTGLVLMLGAQLVFLLNMFVVGSMYTAFNGDLMGMVSQAIGLLGVLVEAVGFLLLGLAATRRAKRPRPAPAMAAPPAPQPGGPGPFPRPRTERSPPLVFSYIVSGVFAALTVLSAVAGLVVLFRAGRAQNSRGLIAAAGILFIVCALLTAAVRVYFLYFGYSVTFAAEPPSSFSTTVQNVLMPVWNLLGPLLPAAAVVMLLIAAFRLPSEQDPAAPPAPHAHPPHAHARPPHAPPMPGAPRPAAPPRGRSRPARPPRADPAWRPPPSTAVQDALDARPRHG